MRTIQEVEKRLECEANFANIASLEVKMPERIEEDCEQMRRDFDKWLDDNGFSEYMVDEK